MVDPRRPLLILTLALAVGGSSAGAADPFYESLLSDGIRLQERGEQPERAVKLLRLACFGLLEEPAELARCLAYLAIAQAETDVEELGPTLHRLIEIEERFGAYSEAGLGPAARREVEDLLVRHVEGPDLRRVAAFRGLAGGRRLAPDEVALADRGTADQDVEPGGSAPPEKLPPEVRRRIREIRGILHSVPREALQGLMSELRRMASEQPASTEVQFLAAEAAYRLRSWKESVVYFRRGGEPSEPALLFYFAVALYESGDRRSAADVLERSLPSLQPTEIVRRYTAKIRGNQSGPQPPRPRTP